MQRTAVVLLASGSSERFPAGDKLLADFLGKPLVAHAAELARSLPFLVRIAVVPDLGGALAALLGRIGFSLVRNARPSEGRESSLRLGLTAALEHDPDAILVLLGDMPLITVSHLEQLHAAADERRAAISTSGEAQMPPVLVPAELAKAAIAQRELPAKQLLAGAMEVLAPAECLRDFDTQKDFADK